MEALLANLRLLLLNVTGYCLGGLGVRLLQGEPVGMNWHGVFWVHALTTIIGTIITAKRSTHATRGE
jgi:hypothetical protein